MTKVWKIACAIVYLAICVLDFLIIPTYIMKKDIRISSYEYHQKIQEIYKDNEEAVRIIISDNNGGDWTPFSLRNGGILHISFGAILTGSIIGRKKED